MTIRLAIGDITTARVDAIVNAANETMLGGGGVDGAIHRAAGPTLREACLQVTAVNGVRCPTGQARITPAGNLPVRHIIHAVGPRYHVDTNPAQLLASAYRNSFQLALDNDCTSLAVPAISCGAFGYPPDEAAGIALEVSRSDAYATLDITFYLFDRATHDIWLSVLQAS